MLRALVLLLLLANAGFWAWRQGWLAPLNEVIGARPQGEREPERLARQVRPETVKLLSPEAASAARRRARPSQPPISTGACLEAGPYTPAELATVQPALQAAWPGGSWTVREVPAGGGQWWVATGPFFNAEAVQSKRDELRRRGILAEQVINGPGEPPLLVLSRHDSRAAAELELAALVERDVRTARVVEGLPRALRALRVPQADAATQALLTGLPVERLRGKPFAPCQDGSS